MTWEAGKGGEERSTQKDAPPPDLLEETVDDTDEVKVENDDEDESAESPTDQTEQAR
ncbi:MAG: hypothetical protein OEM32_02145 [Acidimicrobiia bacterium]|nr:hypothetical protein [Acidimicrobiia bacterium]